MRSDMRRPHVGAMRPAHTGGPLQLDGSSLTIPQLVDHLSQADSKIELVSEAWKRVRESNAFLLRQHHAREICYGLETGLGDLIDVRIPKKYRAILQKRLILSHAVGAREALPIDVSRAILLLRINCLSAGYSGIRSQVLTHLVSLYNRGAYPEIYAAGSLGASGDLAPLSHLAAFAIGHGWGYLRGRRLRSDQIHHRLGLKPVTLQPKEGLSLINGTSAMTAIGVHALVLTARCLYLMLVGMALLLDATHTGHSFLDESGVELKRQRSAITLSKVLRSFLASSATVPSPTRTLQAVYSFRCMPFILGPLLDTLTHVAEVLRAEMNSVNDNPVILAEQRRIFHGGLFHGAPVGIALDQLRVASVHVTGVMDRQVESILDRRRNPGIPPFLAKDTSKGHCGVEGAQYLLTSLHAENLLLAGPTSIMTQSTNAGNQDYVSLGMQSALASLRVAENTHHALAVYLLVSLQLYSLEKRRPGGILADVLDDLTDGLELPYSDDVMLRELLDKIIEPKRLAAVVETVTPHIPDDAREEFHVLAAV